MNAELENALVRRFPKLYHGVTLPLTENLMGFGFECGDGWFDLLYNLSYQIEHLDKKLKTETLALQVKEKFGGLRFYVTIDTEKISWFSKKWEKIKWKLEAFRFMRKHLKHYTDPIWDIIEEAEQKSYKICEECGDDGSMYHRGSWLKTICWKCAGSNERLRDYELFEENTEPVEPGYMDKTV